MSKHKKNELLRRIGEKKSIPYSFWRKPQNRTEGGTSTEGDADCGNNHKKGKVNYQGRTKTFLVTEERETRLGRKAVSGKKEERGRKAETTVSRG